MSQNRKPKGSQDGGQYDVGGFDRADGRLSDSLDAWGATTPPTQTVETPAWINEAAGELDADPTLGVLDAPGEERQERQLAADSADRVLHLFERAHPGDGRVRAAVQAARKVAAGDMSREFADQFRTDAAAAASAARASFGESEPERSQRRDALAAVRAADAAADALRPDPVVAADAAADQALQAAELDAPAHLGATWETKTAAARRRREEQRWQTIRAAELEVEHGDYPLDHARQINALMNSPSHARFRVTLTNGDGFNVTARFPADDSQPRQFTTSTGFETFWTRPEAVDQIAAVVPDDDDANVAVRREWVSGVLDDAGVNGDDLDSVHRYLDDPDLFADKVAPAVVAVAARNDGRECRYDPATAEMVLTVADPNDPFSTVEEREPVLYLADGEYLESGSELMTSVCCNVEGRFARLESAEVNTPF